MEQQRILTKREQEIYKMGMKEGIRAFAWWKDGKQYVGTTGLTLQEALQEVDEQDFPVTIEEKDNARLIAVAAELYAALKRILYLGNHGYSSEIVDRDEHGHPLDRMGVARKQAEEAIAKAEAELGAVTGQRPDVRFERPDGAT